MTFEAHSFIASTTAWREGASPPIIVYVSCPLENLLSQAQQMTIEGDIWKKLSLLVGIEWLWCRDDASASWKAECIAGYTEIRQDAITGIVTSTVFSMDRNSNIKIVSRFSNYLND